MGPLSRKKRRTPVLARTSGQTKVQPEYDQGCTLASYNPLSNQIEWIAVNCREKFQIPVLSCFPDNSVSLLTSYTKNKLLLLYVRDYLPSFLTTGENDNGISFTASLNCKKSPVSIRFLHGTISYYLSNKILSESDILLTFKKLCSISQSLDNLIVFTYYSRFNLRQASSFFPMHSTQLINHQFIATSPATCSDLHINIGNYCLSFNVHNKVLGEPVMSKLGNYSSILKFKLYFAQYAISDIYLYKQGDQKLSIHKNSATHLYLHMGMSHMTNRTGGCPTAQFTCNDGNCISEAFLMDGEAECMDGSDELSTSLRPRVREAMLYLYSEFRDIAGFYCGQKQYKKQWMYVEDKYGTKGNYTSSDLRCEELIDFCHTQVPFICSSSKTAIDSDLVNDLVPDCSLADDEPILSKGLVRGDEAKHLAMQCFYKGEVPCMHGHPRCIPAHRLCVFDLDRNGHIRYCRNGGHLIGCEAVGCPALFKCPGFYCISIIKVCNGVFDCPGNDDERHCAAQPLTCPGLFPCKEGGCLDQLEVCDGVKHCLGGEDELGCDIDSCPLGCHCQVGVLHCHNVASVAGVPLNISGYSYIKITAGLKTFPTLSNVFNSRILSFSNNEFGSLLGDRFSGFGNLVGLDISKNSLRTLEGWIFSGLKKLQKLDLSSNALGEIDPMALYGLEHLTSLNFSDTGLRVIPCKLFHNTPFLTHLYLQSSKLSILDFSIINQLVKFETLHIQLTETERIINMPETTDPKSMFTIMTDDPIVCCMVKRRVSCTTANPPISWCGSNALHPVSTMFVTTVETICVVLTMIIKWRRSGRVFVLFTGMGFVLCDLHKSIHDIITISKDYIFGINLVHRELGAKYFVCHVAAVLECVAYFGLSFLVILHGLAIRDSTNIVSALTTKIVKTIIVISIILPIIYGVITFFLGLKLCTLSDACSFVFPAENMGSWCFLLPIPLVLLSVINIVTTMLLYYKAISAIRISSKAISSMGGARSGRKVGVSDIVKHFLFNVFGHGLVVLSIAIYVSIALSGTLIDTRTQMLISVSILPLFLAVNNATYIVRVVLEKYN